MLYQQYRLTIQKKTEMTNHSILWLILTVVGAAALLGAFYFGISGALGFFLLAMVSIAVLGLRDVLSALHLKKERQEAMRQAADRLGWQFRETANFNVLGWPESFQLTREGMKTQKAVKEALSPGWQSVLLPKSINVLEQTLDDATFAIFDYHCDNPHVEDATYTQTIFAARSASLNFPYLALLPVTWRDKLVASFRETAIVDDRYRLFCEDAGDVGVSEELTALLDGKICLEVGEGFLLLYRKDKLVDPRDVDSFLQGGLEVYKQIELRPVTT